jgi:hypothetical protein
MFKRKQAVAAHKDVLRAAAHDPFVADKIGHELLQLLELAQKFFPCSFLATLQTVCHTRIYRLRRDQLYAPMLLQSSR